MEALAASQDPALQDQYVRRRDAEFSKFLETLGADTHGALDAVLSPDAERPDATWISPEFKNGVLRPEISDPLDPQNAVAASQELIDAYSNARIGAQSRYAWYLTRATGPFTTHPAAQRSWLHRRGLALLMAIFALHIIVLAGLFLFHIPALLLKTIHVSAIILALIALGLRAIEDGLRPAEHLGRITGYLAEVNSIKEAFEEATNGWTRRNLMIALEKASYKEMVDFLRAGNRSRYVM